MKWLFVVTYGRSGSTLLLGLLNQLDRTLIRGENDLFVFPLAQAYNHLKIAQGHVGPLDPTNPWFGAEQLNPSAYLQQARDLIMLQLLGTWTPDEVDVLGFKEIRYFDLPETELVRLLDFLSLVFPGCHFVIHTRRHEEVAKSGWWIHEDREELLARLERFEAILTEYFERMPPSRQTWTSHQEAVNDPLGLLERLQKALGVATPTIREEVEWAMHRLHSTSGPESSTSQNQGDKEGIQTSEVSDEGV